MYENRIVDNLPSTEDSQYCELGQRRIKHNYIHTQSYARIVLFTMINTNGRALYRAKLECKVSNLFSKIPYLNYAYKYTNVPNTITFDI